MTTLAAILDNPFRILGVYSNSSIKDRLANKNRMNAFLRVGKQVSYPIDLSAFIPQPVRNSESVALAESRINLPEDLLRHALFWFIKADSVDDIALNNLQSGNVQKAREILGRRETFSTTINLAVLDFVDENYSSGIERIFTLIHNDQHRDAFINAVCGEGFVYSEEQLSNLFSQELEKEFSLAELVDFYLDIDEISYDEYSSQRDRLGKQIHAKVKIEVDRVKTFQSSDYSSYQILNEATKLKNAVAEHINQIQSYFESGESYCQLVCDSVATEIRQLVLYAMDDDSCDYDKCKALISYASEIAQSSLLIKQLSETLDQLEQKEIYGRVEDEQNLIASATEAAIKASTFFTARKYLQQVKPALDRIAQKLGPSDPFYEFSGTIVVATVLGIVIKIVNHLQNNITREIVQNGTFEHIINEGLSLLESVSSIPCDTETRQRLQTNLGTIRNIKNQINQAKTKQEAKESSGCLIWFILGVIALFVFGR